MKIIESFNLLNIKEKVLLIIIVLLLSLLLLIIVNSSGVQNFNPDINHSFNGVKWGDAIENYPDMIKYFAYENDDIVTYYKSGDISPFKSLEPDEVLYAFQNGKFRAAAAFYGAGEPTLLYEMIDQYGPPLFSLKTIAIRMRIYNLIDLIGYHYLWNYEAVKISYRRVHTSYIAIFDYRPRKEAGYHLQWFFRPHYIP